MDRHAKRVEAIQLLRALAAGIVTLQHLAFGFADHIGAGLSLARPPGNAGQVAVAMFFAVSGYVMVVSSAALFGTRGASLRFWRRRLVRIVPPYWIATGLLAGWYLVIGRTIDMGLLWRSLLLWPHWPAGGDPGSVVPLPLLWPGWTLFYEILFYAAFGLFLASGRRATVVLTMAVLAALIIAGTTLDPASAPMFALTRPVTILFIFGMLLAIWRQAGGALPMIFRISLGVAALAGAVMAPGSGGMEGLGIDWLGNAGLAAALGVAALAGGPLRLPAFAMIDRLGDWSYALYLLHLPLAEIWIWIYVRTVPSPGGWGFFVSAALLAYGISAAFFTLVERPLTTWLNRRLSGHEGRDELLQQTGV